MDEIGYVFSPLDLKILILFILRRLPGEIDSERLLQICQEDGVVNYFDFTICMDELKESGQLELEDGFCIITPRGRQTAETLETSLPYSVRQHAEKAAGAVASDISRGNSISGRHSVTYNGCVAELSLNDGISEILQLRILCADEEQAKHIEKKFRRNAEETYQKIIAVLSE